MIEIHLALTSSLQISPSQAQGGNSAMEASVTLANELNSLAASHRKRDSQPSTGDIELAFSRYQTVREMKLQCMSASNQGYNMLEGWTDRVQRTMWHVCNMVFDWQPYVIVDLLTAPWTARSAKLDYVQFGEELQGRYPWKDPKTADPPVGFLGGVPRFFWTMLGWRASQC